jgi:hypothetical protein
LSYKTIESENPFSLPSSIEDDILNNKQKSDLKVSFSMENMIKTNKWIRKDLNELKKEITVFRGRIDQWEVEFDKNESLQVMEFKPQIIDGVNFNIVESHDGFFLGLNTMENSGALYFYPNGDKNKKYKLLDGYIWDTYRLKNDVYAVASYPEKIPPNGKVLRIKRTLFGWKVVKVIDLDDTPMCYTILDNNRVLIATQNKLIIIKDNKISEVVIDNAFWDSLYPNSIACKNGVAYLGMIGGIGRVNLLSKEVDFYTPKQQ